MIKAYSDSSTVNNRSAATSVLLTERNFIGIVTGVYYDVVTASEGELIGIIQSMRYIHEHLPDEKKVTIYCDSESIVQQYISILKSWEIPGDIKYKKRWQELLRLSKKYNITVEHIYGHQDSHNPNKVCDMLSNTLMQRMRE